MALENPSRICQSGHGYVCISALGTRWPTSVAWLMHQIFRKKDHYLEIKWLNAAIISSLWIFPFTHHLIPEITPSNCLCWALGRASMSSCNTVSNRHTVPALLGGLMGVQSNNDNTVDYGLESNDVLSPVVKQRKSNMFRLDLKELGELPRQTMCQLLWALVSRYVVKHHSRSSHEDFWMRWTFKSVDVE